MELQNYNQDIISTSSSDIPQNYPDINNPSIQDNKYGEGQFQTQQQYNPPPLNNNIINLKILDIPILKTNLSYPSFQKINILRKIMFNQ